MLHAPFTISPLAPFSLNFFAPCFFFTFFLFHFSMVPAPFYFFLLLHDFCLAPYSFLEFSPAPCSFLSSLWLLAPGLTFVCSLLLYLFHCLLLAPLCQTGVAPCSGITPNMGSMVHKLTGRPMSVKCILLVVKLYVVHHVVRTLCDLNMCKSQWGNNSANSACAQSRVSANIKGQG